MPKIQLDFNETITDLDLPEAHSTYPSIFAFGVHKSGSTLLHALLETLYADAGIPVVRFPDLMFQRSLPISNPEIANQLGAHLRPTGYAYLGAREFWCENVGFDIGAPKKVLLVRDPRDALVSYYFSDKLSHGIPEGATKMQETREMLQQTESIENDPDYIRSRAKHLVYHYTAYMRLTQAGNVRVYNYEHIIFQKRIWARDMCDYLGIDLSETQINAAADKHDIVPTSERPDKHIRQVYPGSHIKHLSAETIRQLNDTFSEADEFFGFRKALFRQF